MARQNYTNDHEESESDAAEPLLGERRHLNSSQLIYDRASQEALVGAKICHIESLDYEIIENEFYKHNWKGMTSKERFQYVSMKWILCLLLGLFMSVVGLANNLIVENIVGEKFVVTTYLMEQNRYVVAFFVFLAWNFGLTLFAASITSLIAPTAAGSGIPEVKAYLNGVDAPRIYTMRCLFVKIIGSIAAVSASLLVGKSGPMIHIGGAAAHLLGQGGSRKYGLTWKWLRYFKNDRDRRDLVTCGSAAGITAAFRAPVGGVLFALEEMSSWWRSALLWRAFFTTAVVVVMIRAYINYCSSGYCGLFGSGGLIMFDLGTDYIDFHLMDVPFVVLVGIAGGLLGSFFNFLLTKIIRVHAMLYEKGAVVKISVACLLSIFTSCLLFGLPWLATCQSCPSDSSSTCPTSNKAGNYMKFQCSSSEYNDLASLIFNTNDDAIKYLYSQDTESEFNTFTILAYFGSCFLLSVVSFGIVVPAGLFVPLIVTGASYGRYMGILFSSYTSLNEGLFAVLGTAAFLAGSMRATVALCVIILEFTNNLYLLPLVMIVLLVAKSVADIFNENISDALMKIKGFPYLTDQPEVYMRRLTVSDVVSGPLRWFPGVEKVGNIVHILRSTTHNGFPVIDDDGGGQSNESPSSPVLYGLVLRSHLLVLLQKKAFVSQPVRTGVEAFHNLSSVDFAKGASGKVVTIDDVELTAQEMEMFIDLHPFSNSSPFTVVETMSLAKGLELFRQVGLRHMLVIPKTVGILPVVGILTRHDFMPEHIMYVRPAVFRGEWRRIKFQLPRVFRCLLPRS